MTTKNGLDEILSKCARLMAKQGYDGTSMRDLARETGRSLAGLYHYFKSKEELLYLINSNGFGLLLQSAQAISRMELSAEEKLFAFISNHIRYFSSHLDEMKVIMFGTRQIDKKQGKSVKALKDQYTEIAETIIADFLSEGLGKRVTKTAITRKTFLLFGMMNWTAGWYSPEVHGSNESLIEDIFRVFTQGIGEVNSIEVNRNGCRYNRTQM